MCARYTASGGAANRLVTITCVSPSVFSVSRLIVVSFSSALGDPQWPALRPAARNLFPELFSTLRAIRPWRRHPRGPGGGAASRHQPDEQRAPHLPAPSDAEKWLADSCRRARLARSQSLRFGRAARESLDASDRPGRKRPSRGSLA